MRKKFNVSVIFLAILILFIDQITKYYAMYLWNEKKVVLLEAVLELKYTENTGAAFGIFEGNNMFIMLFGIVLVSGLLFKYFKLSKNGKNYGMRIAMLVLIAGAVGNLIDRLKYGFVIDFIYFVPIDFPKFNCADMCIVSSLFVIGYLFLFVYKEDFEGDRK